MTLELSPEDDGRALLPRILIVDDSLTIRHHVREVLSRAPLGAEVLEAEDGVSALRLALDERIDCVVCDVRMPRLDGLSFLKQLRNQWTRFELPLIFLSVVEGTRDKVAGFRAGASDFIVKPFEADELIARVETQVQLARNHRRLHRLTEHLKVMVDTDALTGVGNRRLFMRNLRAEFGRAERMGHRLALLMIDVDRFKLVNDQHGHQEGDRVLTSVAGVLSEGARPYDTVARLGGEEFAVLLPEVERPDALKVAGRLRAAVEKAGQREKSSVTVSIGVATGPAPGKDHPEALYRRADEQLYAAKEGGRNRVFPAV